MRTDIYEILDSVSSSGKKVLATIIDVEGSSYRKAGSVMLFRENGQHAGLLSGGCLEQDLFLRSEKLLKESISAIVVYDLSSEDDLSWGQGAGCNGIIRIVIEAVTPVLEMQLKEVKRLVNQGVDVTHIKKISLDGVVTDTLFLTNDDEAFGEWQGKFPDVLNITNNTLLKENGYYLFIQRFTARPRLFIYGAGADAIPLAHLAYFNGFYTIIADWRPAFCNNKFFPFADETCIALPSEFSQTFDFLSKDSVVLMTHNYEKDHQLLDKLLNKELGYLGILGSKNRAERLLRGKMIPEWVRFPVGLSIGAEGPNEIAVSIIGEIIKTKAGRLAFEC